MKLKAEHILKHIKVVLWGVAVAFLAQIMVAAEANAQTVAQPIYNTPTYTQADVDQLLLAALALNERVLSAPIPVQQKVSLLRTLLTITQSVLNLQLRLSAQTGSVASVGGDTAQAGSSANTLNTSNVNTDNSATLDGLLQSSNVLDQQALQQVASEFSDYYDNNQLNLSSASTNELVDIVNEVLSNVSYSGGPVEADEAFVEAWLQSLGFDVN